MNLIWTEAIYSCEDLTIMDLSCFGWTIDPEDNVDDDGFT